LPPHGLLKLEGKNQVLGSLTLDLNILFKNLISYVTLGYGHLLLPVNPSFMLAARAAVAGCPGIRVLLDDELSQAQLTFHPP